VFACDGVLEDIESENDLHFRCWWFRIHLSLFGFLALRFVAFGIALRSLDIKLRFHDLV
jgi:hypothetical protein